MFDFLNKIFVSACRINKLQDKFTSKRLNYYILYLKVATKKSLKSKFNKSMELKEYDQRINQNNQENYRLKQKIQKNDL